MSSLDLSPYGIDVEVLPCTSQNGELGFDKEIAAAVK